MMRHSCTLAVLLTLLAPAVAVADAAAALERVRAAEAQRVAVLAAAAKSVVCIFTDRQLGGGGSGVLIDEAGYGLTNYHVIAALLENDGKGYGGLSDGQLYPLEVLGIDPGGDIAVFKLTGRSRFDVAPLGDSDALSVGQPVFAMGNPFLLAEDFQPTVTSGFISGLHRYQGGAGDQSTLEYADCIQVTTSINPGNSGGPLFDAAGQVVGINGRASFKIEEVQERGRVNVGLGYAVTINQIKRFLPCLRSGALCLHGTLGATVREIGDDLVFDAIQEDSPADRADIGVGDVLLAIDGEAIPSANAFNNLIATVPAHWPLTLRVRGEAEREVAASLEPLRPRGMPAWVPSPAHLQRELMRYWPGIVAWCAPQSAGLAAIDVSVGGAAPAEQVVLQLDTFAAALAGGGIADEFRLAAAPWLAEELPEPAIALTYVRTDRLAERVLAVFGYRPADVVRVAWRFDTASRELVDAEIYGADGRLTGVWRPVGARLPATCALRWERLAGRDGGDDAPVAQTADVTVRPAAEPPTTVEATPDEGTQ